MDPFTVHLQIPSAKDGIDAIKQRRSVAVHFKITQQLMFQKESIKEKQKKKEKKKHLTC